MSIYICLQVLNLFPHFISFMPVCPCKLFSQQQFLCRFHCSWCLYYPTWLSIKTSFLYSSLCRFVHWILRLLLEKNWILRVKTVSKGRTNYLYICICDCIERLHSMYHIYMVKWTHWGLHEIGTHSYSELFLKYSL